MSVNDKLVKWPLNKNELNEYSCKFSNEKYVPYMHDYRTVHTRDEEGGIPGF